MECDRSQYYRVPEVRQSDNASRPPSRGCMVEWVDS